MSETPMSRAQTLEVARATRRRTKHDRWAEEMREAGWICTPPAVDIRAMARRLRAESA